MHDRLHRLHTLDGGESVSFSACTGSCHQGRVACPHPQACELPEDDGPGLLASGAFWLLGLVSAVCMVALIAVLTA